MKSHLIEIHRMNNVTIYTTKNYGMSSQIYYQLKVEFRVPYRNCKCFMLAYQMYSAEVKEDFNFISVNTYNEWPQLGLP